MFDIKCYMNDGANFQAQAVLAILRGRVVELEDISWDKDRHKTNVICEIGRFENCREQGYVFRVSHNYTTIMNYCFYEHRNIDSICVIKFESNSINTPSIDEVWRGRESKYDVDATFDYLNVVETADWIINDATAEIRKYIDNKETEND